MSEEKKSVPPSYLVTRKYLKTISLPNAKLVCAVDTSGSTAGAILRWEIAFAKQFDTIKKFIAWSDHAILCDDISDSKIKSGGGTFPMRILQGDSLKCVQDAECKIFMTDGEVEQKEITEFAKLVSHVPNLALTICVIVGSHSKPSTCNLSVFAPLLASNAIVLFHNGAKIYVLRTSGSVKFSSPVITEDTEWKDVQEVTFEDLKEKLQVDLLEPTPAGFTCIGDNKAINFDLFLANDFKRDDEFMKLPIADIVLLAKTQERLADLRKWVTKYRRSVKDTEMQLRKDAQSPNSQQISKLLGMLSAENIPEKKNEIRQEITKLMPLAINEEKKHREVINNLVQPFSAFLGEMDRLISDAEKSGYDVASMGRLSNRAARAKTVKAISDDDFFGLDMKDALSGECSVMLDTYPLALMLRKHISPEENTQDLVINFPLAFGVTNIQTVGSEVVSVDVARHYVQNGKDGIHQPVVCFLPAVKMTDNNKSFIYRAFATALTDGVALPHVGLLAFATLFEALQKGRDNKVLKHILLELLDNVKTTPTFLATEQTTTETKKVTLREALQTVVTSPDFMRQPFSACCLIIEALIYFDLKYDMAKLVNILRQRLMRHLVSYYRLKLVTPPTDTTQTSVSDVVKCIETDIFRTDYGVPLHGSAREVCFDKCTALEALLTHHKEFQQQVSRVCGSMKVTVDQFIPPSVLTACLYTIRNVTTCNFKPDELIDELCREELFLRAYNSDMKDATPFVNKMFKNALTQGVHNTPPPFVSTLGPPLLVCTCGYVFAKDCVGKKCELKTIIDSCFANRSEHFASKEVYGDIKPSPVSAHTPLHITVARIMRHHFAEAKTLERKMVLAVLKDQYKNKGSRGNIFASHYISDVTLAVHSYLLARQKFGDPKEAKGIGLMTLNGKTRLEIELESLGVTPDGNGNYTVPDGLILRPVEMDKELLDELSALLTPDEKIFVSE